MKKVLSILLLCSSLVGRMEANVGRWVMPALVPFGCKMVQNMAGSNNKFSCVLDTVSEGSASALAQRVVYAGVNKGLDLGKDVDMSMSSMMVDTAINSTLLASENLVTWPANMKTAMDNTLYRTLAVCVLNQLARTAWKSVRGLATN